MSIIQIIQVTDRSGTTKLFKPRWKLPSNIKFVVGKYTVPKPEGGVDSVCRVYFANNGNDIVHSVLEGMHRGAKEFFSGDANNKAVNIYQNIDPDIPGVKINSPYDSEWLYKAMPDVTTRLGRASWSVIPNPHSEAARSLKGARSSHEGE